MPDFARVPNNVIYAFIISQIFIIILAICIAMPSLFDDGVLIESDAKSISCKSLKRLREKDGSCGKCMEWYTSDDITGKDECTPLANITIPMTEHNSFIPNGSTVILKCKFDSYQTCNWKRGESNIGVDHNYRYIGPNKGINTKDCSLQIVKFTDFDAGDWICRGMATSDSSGPFGTQVALSNEVIVTARNRSTTYVEIGESIALKCYFDEPVNCVWYRHDESVVITNRYSYIASNSSGINTRDCSIKITSLKDIDIVTWKCKSMATSSKNDTLSTITRLRKINATEVIPGPPQPYFVTIGEQISLNCKFSVAVNCKWTRNEKNLEITDRYKYTNGTSSTDCSITVESIDKKDIGEWTCSSEDFTDIEPSAISWSIKKRTPSKPKIFLSKHKGLDGNIICLLENGLSETDLHWKLDGVQAQMFNKTQLRNSDNAIYVYISINYSGEQFKNISLLSCVAKHDLGEWKDEIKVIDVKVFMTEQAVGKSTVTMTGLITGIIVILVLLVASVICYLKCIKNRQPSASRKTENVDYQAVTTPLSSGSTDPITT